MAQTIAARPPLTSRIDGQILTALSILWIVSFVCSSCSIYRAGDSKESGAPAVEAARRDRYQQYFAANLAAPQPYALPRKALYGEPDSFGLLADLAVMDNRLIALDSRSALGVALIDRRDGTISRPTHPGAALDGATEPNGVSAAEGKNIWLYFGLSGKWARFDFDSPETRPTRVIDLPPSLSQPAWIGDRIVTTGIFAGELLRLYKVQDGATKLAGALGPPPFPDVKPDLAIHLNRTRLVVRPSGDRLALAFRYVSRIHVYDTQGGLERAIAGPEEVELRYGVAHDPREGIDRFVRTVDTRLAYLDVAASDKLIFGLFCGRRRGDFPDTASYGNEIHFFGWDGRFVGVGHLEEDVYRIVWDPTRNTLLGLRELPFPAVLEFSLGSLGETDARPSQAS